MIGMYGLNSNNDLQFANHELNAKNCTNERRINNIIFNSSKSYIIIRMDNIITYATFKQLIYMNNIGLWSCD